MSKGEVKTMYTDYKKTQEEYLADLIGPVKRDVKPSIFEVIDGIVVGIKVGYDCPSCLYIPTKVDGQKVSAIADEAFSYKGILYVKLPETLEYVGISAFEGNNLVEITIPRSVEYVYSRAFANNNLEQIEVLNANTKLHKIYGSRVDVFDDNDAIRVYNIAGKNAKNPEDMGYTEFFNNLLGF